MQHRLAPLLLLISAACAETRGTDWVRSGTPDYGEIKGPAPIRTVAAPAATRDMSSRPIGAHSPEPDDPETELTGVRTQAAARGRPLGSFRNTYYSFPSESDFQGTAVPIYDATCRVIADVPETFHDRLCVQGSGRLVSQRTVSFAKRDCACARVCPRTQQRICYEALDPAAFPWGRGAANRPISPMRTVAVDSSVIPLGTGLYIPAYAGLPTAGGGTHSGCFVAEDRGLHVAGQQIDIFAGAENMLKDWNRRVPTGMGVEVFADPTCASR